MKVELTKDEQKLVDEIIPFNGMKVLEIDIETKPHKGYFFGLFNQNIGINQVIEPTQILCFDARWQHETKHLYFSIMDIKKNREKSFENMIEAMWDLMDEADVIIHYNGKRFDVPHINRELLELGYYPPSPYQQIDLYSVVRSTFRFMSNKFDHIVQRLFNMRKLENGGFQLWTDCMAGDPEAWETMEEYNKHDVNLLRCTYLRLQPWINQHPNRGLYVADSSQPICPNCGSVETMRVKAYRNAEPGINTAKTRVNVFPQYLCDPDKTDKKSKRAGCGRYSRGRLAIKRNRDGIVT